MDIDKQWHIKKELPISTVAMFLVQIGTLVWFIATLQARMDQAEQKITAYAPTVERIIKLEAKVESVQDGISEIKVILRNTVPTSKRSEINQNR